MKIPDVKWYEAIKVRRSRRQFNGQPIDTQRERQMLDFIDELNSRVDGFRAVFVKENPDKVFRGAVGSYGKIKGAPAYVAFVGDMSDPNVQEKAGYLGECVILEATSAGLATCWVGGFFDQNEVKAQINLIPGERVLAVSPVGFTEEKYNLEEKLMSGLAGSHKRKSLSRIAKRVSVEKWPYWVSNALEAARLSPSAVNRQPWRFIVSEDSIVISVDNRYFSFGISKRLDCGIAMLHFHIGALKAGVQGNWEYLTEPDVARFVVS